MTTLYWVGEYVKVFGGYLFLMFLWPAVVFGRHLKGKPKSYQFGFCSVVQIVLLNTLVLGLGLLHILNRWTVNLVLYGLFFVMLLRQIPWKKEMAEQLYSLLTGTCGKKLFLIKTGKQLWNWSKGRLKELWKRNRQRIFEYLLLLALLVYAIIYFSWGAFQDHSYGSGDIYVHHGWLYGLTEGRIFSDGVYPEGMHCFIYSLYAFFGIRIDSILLFLQGIHVVTLLLSVYFLMREIFHWRYTPLLMLLMFLMLNVHTVNSIYGMSRLQWTIPQEFSLHTQFVCALFLVRYLKSTQFAVLKKRVSKFYWDENLFLFMMALAASLVTHFYVTIMAFFLCASFALCMLRRVFDKKRLIPLIAAVLCGVMAALLPIAGGLASGIPFQGSMGWALSVIEGTDEETMEEAVSQEETALVQESRNREQTSSGTSFLQVLKNKADILYTSGYDRLYPGMGGWIVGLTCFSIFAGLIRHALDWLRNLSGKKAIAGERIDGYLPIAFVSVIFMIIYVSPDLGIPQIIKDSRLCVLEHLLILMVAVVPVDILFSLLVPFVSDTFLQGFSLLAIGAVAFGIVFSGNYHSFLYYELARYNSAVEVSNSIIDSLSKNTYTIVSPVNELYQVIEYGRHEELLTFARNICADEDTTYKIPTEYVFLFVEKRPIKYAQHNFFKGPSWLGREEYAQYYMQFIPDRSSQYPQVLASEISAESAQKSIPNLEKLSDSYSDLESRTILESKLYLWCQAFAQTYPFELEVYYEDDSFICYTFRQNTQALYNLNLKGWEETDGVQW
ncbi:MAG: hypothetical protein HFG27_03210 [Provencibacterium sp.]|nr:hypothetical protein [Provencibacterium sp.]